MNNLAARRCKDEEFIVFRQHDLFCTQPTAMRRTPEVISRTQSKPFVHTLNMPNGHGITTFKENSQHKHKKSPPHFTAKSYLCTQHSNDSKRPQAAPASALDQMKRGHNHHPKTKNSTRQGKTRQCLVHCIRTHAAL